ncbi:MAG: TRAP transporter permease [Aminobacterium sp.]|jgi:TRAP transporter 4TM/12TM fusion protein|uniref:TRAP transporter permease n=1 Tax=Aminobacterium sp. MB27-C1 TaxID=3070661 RepID=UPI0027DB445F|nr:TRAP transporter permease [Aminobacterium sp. MB27-C1]MDD2206682.1 TRAP transporter permease [Aminobacterium sp.]MDD3425323.1 TRAP transporter permease [Aminobacterium sp.]MDD3706900.1 TRAP transporter permease [Aminobacterium sp.]MDD4228844.1 TRAP transporter permease [Aminobacterium sp.]MDD4551041.1 TRAP transporter permease [Aminobacterium sp.]
MFFKKKEQENLTPEEKLKELNEKFEKKRNLTGIAAKICSILAICMSLYHMYSSGIHMLPQFQHRAIHLAFALALTFFIFPATSKQKNRLPIWDIVAIVFSLAVGAYLTLDYMNIVFRMGDPIARDIVIGAVMIFLVLEATRRTMGWPLVIVAICFLLYAFFGHLIPGTLGHRQYGVERIVEHMFLTSEGIYGVAIYVTATFVFLFILLGAFLTETGGAQAFIDLAFSLTGRFRGGPAKAAVLASGLMGTISGSSFANVAGTGTFTIPLMKSVGYKPEFAGGVEASASTGGQIMPPIMGAAAFIMAEMTGVPYGKLIVHAAIPAILYYVAVFIMVDMEAAKLGLFGMKKSELPVFSKVFKDGAFLLLAPFSIVYMLLAGYSPIKASVTAVLIVIITSSFRKATRMSLKSFLRALDLGARGALSVIAACAVAGLIVGTVTLTGLGLKFADFIIALSGGQLHLALLLTMIASIIMGMGMPTTALYIILGSMVAPALVKLSVPVVAAHLFIFYFGCMASVTPPVALSSYLAAAIAKADSVKTALQGLKLSSSAFILPFVFALSPRILLLNTSLGSATTAIITATLGVVALSASLEGYLMGRLPLLLRAVAGVAAICLIDPGWLGDVIGLVILSVILLSQIIARKKRYEARDEVNSLE